MTNWTQQLNNGVRTALLSGVRCRVVVHSEAQAELGKRAVDRLRLIIGGDASKLSFALIPESAQDMFSVGNIFC